MVLLYNGRGYLDNRAEKNAKDGGSVTICTICDGDFDLELEGGVEGYIGILPVAFCPTCKAGILDFAEQFNYNDEEDDPSDRVWR